MQLIRIVLFLVAIFLFHRNSVYFKFHARALLFKATQYVVPLLLLLLISWLRLDDAPSHFIVHRFLLIFCARFGLKLLCFCCHIIFAVLVIKLLAFVYESEMLLLTIASIRLMRVFTLIIIIASLCWMIQRGPGLFMRVPLVFLVSVFW